MDPHQVALDANLGGGWVARLAEFAETRSSIVLVTVEREDDRRSLRLDIGKGMFLDPPPSRRGSACRARRDQLDRAADEPRANPVSDLTNAPPDVPTHAAPHP